MEFHEASNVPLASDNSIPEVPDQRQAFVPKRGVLHLSPPEPSLEYKDKFFALLFAGHLGVVLLMAVRFVS